jgi:hypothetical protein
VGPRYEHAPFWLWHAHDEELQSGAEIGPADIDGLDETLRVGNRLGVSLNPTSDAALWFDDWATAQQEGEQGRVLVVHDGARKRWLKLSAFIVRANFSDGYYSLALRAAERLDEAPLLVEP